MDVNQTYYGDHFVKIRISSHVHLKLMLCHLHLKKKKGQKDIGFISIY